MKLRDYQTTAIAAVMADWAAGILNLLLVMATGLGKTNTFLSIAMQFADANPKARILCLAHRKELIEQPLERIAKIDPAWLMRESDLRPRVGIVMADRDDCDRQFVIATIQTLASEKRLARLLAHGAFDMLIIDECHHATAPTYLGLYKRLRAANPAMRHLGVTATPVRGDGDGLVRVYEKVSATVSIADGVTGRYLLPPKWLGISTGLSIKGVKTTGGDFVQSQLAKIFDTPAGRDVIVRSYQQYGGERKAIAFTASVAGAHELAAEFTTIGVPAAAIDGTTPKDERSRILSAFKAGEYRILANCAVLTEGFDAPGTSCILMCAPTRADGAYLQKMGRGLRPSVKEDLVGEERYLAGHGEDCLILDFIPAESRNIVLAGDVLGLPRNVTREAIRIASDEPGEVQGAFTFDGHHFRTDGTPLEIIARELDYLQASNFSWHRRDGWMVLGLGEGGDRIERILAISPSSDSRPRQLVGIWRRIRIETDDAGEERSVKAPWQSTVIAEHTDVDVLGQRANVLAHKHANATLATKERSWHRQPISDAQRSFLLRLADKRELGQVERMTKGEAAQVINFYTARKVLMKQGKWAA